MRERARTGQTFRKLKEVTHIHVLHWHCPQCGQELAHLMTRKTVTIRACPACAREFQIKEDEVFAIEPLYEHARASSSPGRGRWSGKNSPDSEGMK